MKTLRRILPILVLVGGASAAWQLRAPRPAEPLRLYGNVDFRQVSLAFNASERIAQLLVNEGDRVRKGQLLARLDDRQLRHGVDQAEAAVDVCSATLEKLRNGTRPEEIAQARANLAAAQAQALDAQRRFARTKSLESRAVVSHQEADSATAEASVAQAKVEVNRRALALALLGPRPEDVKQAEAQLKASQAQLALARKQLADAELTSPDDAIVRSRLLEAGDMASPSRPVFSLALTGTKWVRAYVSEPNLGQLRPGQKTRITVDSNPARPFSGWIGFISPVAEFTPKSVQTEDLRSSLVYEVRVFVDDPGEELRLGVPATVRLVNQPVERVQTAAAAPVGSAATVPAASAATRPK